MGDDDKWYQNELFYFFKNSQFFKCISLFVIAEDFLMLGWGKNIFWRDFCYKSEKNTIQNEILYSQ